MKNKKYNNIIIWIFIIIIILGSIFIISKQFKKTNSIDQNNVSEIQKSNYVSYNNSNSIQFSEKNIKTKKNIRIEIKVMNLNNLELRYRISDSNKVRIISSSNDSCIIERVSDFTDTTTLIVYVLDNPNLKDECIITSYNEVTKINDIWIYSYYEDPINGHTYDEERDYVSQYISNYYVIELNTERVRFFDSYEEETIKDIQNFIKENFFSSSNMIEDVHEGEIGFLFYMNVEKIFKNEFKKTFKLTLDRGDYIIILNRA